MITDINEFKEGAILYWHRDEGEHMLGRVTRIEENVIHLCWYLDSTGDIDDYDDDYQFNITDDVRANLIGYMPWLEYTDIITEQEQMILLLKHSGPGRTK
jgi:hypothetical protein